MNTKRTITIWLVLTLIGMLIMFAPYFKFYGLKEERYIDVYVCFTIIYFVFTIIFARRITNIK